MRKLFLALLLGSAPLAGCGSDTKDIMPPNQPLTEEQKAAIKAQDEQVQNEEGGTILKFDNKAN